MALVAKEFDPPFYSPTFLVRRRLLQHFKKLTPQLTGRMMDFGCGNKPYKALITVDEYIGVDYENEGHPHLNEQIDVFYNGKDLPFSNAYFDSVFSSEVFEHVFHLEHTLAELNRVLKPGGQLLFSCPFAFCEHEVPHDFARYSSYGLRSLLERNGFQIMVQEKAGNSLETIHQLLTVYLQYNVLNKLRNVPVLRSVSRVVTYSLINISALLWGRLLPDNKTLYLNNIVLCKKAVA